MNIYVIFDDCTIEQKDFHISPITVNELSLVSEIKSLFQRSNDTETYLIYRGDIISDSVTLKELGISEGGVIKISTRKLCPNRETIPNANLVSEIITKHKKILKTRSKEMINKIILQEMDNIIETHPELESDLIAYSIAFDYRLLRTLFSNPENVSRILEKHPVLIPAALKTVNIINERLHRLADPKQIAKSSPEVTTNSRYFSLREVEQSDNSSSSEDEETDQPSTSSSSQSRRPEIITRSQLRQAVRNTAVLGRGARNNRSSASRITLEQLRDAYQSTVPAASLPVSDERQAEPMDVDLDSQIQSSNVDLSMEEKLAQLHSMGFIDSHANKIALEATGGNVEAAIEYLII